MKLYGVFIWGEKIVIFKATQTAKSLCVKEKLQDGNFLTGAINTISNQVFNRTQHDLLKCI